MREIFVNILYFIYSVNGIVGKSVKSDRLLADFLGHSFYNLKNQHRAYYLEEIQEDLNWYESVILEYKNILEISGMTPE